MVNMQNHAGVSLLHSTEAARRNSHFEGSGLCAVRTEESLREIRRGSAICLMIVSRE